LATFHSFVKALYSDISVVCNDLDAGSRLAFRNNIIVYRKNYDILTKMAIRQYQ